MTIAAQIVLYIDDKGVIRAEAAQHGMASRRRLELRDGMWEAYLKAELNAMSAFARDNRAEVERIADMNKRQSMADSLNRRAKEIYDDVARKHSGDLADRVVPSLAGRTKKVLNKGLPIHIDESAL